MVPLWRGAVPSPSFLPPDWRGLLKLVDVLLLRVYANDHGRFLRHRIAGRYGLHYARTCQPRNARSHPREYQGVGTSQVQRAAIFLWGSSPG